MEYPIVHSSLVLVLVSLLGVFTAFSVVVASAPDPLDPKPDPAAVVVSGNARFTVLTESIIRMQYGQQHDAPTFTFVNRKLPVPLYNHTMQGDWLVIRTAKVELMYLTSSKLTFSQDNLQVYVNSTNRTWKPVPTHNISLEGNLLGTTRTLDHNMGASNMDMNCLTNKDPDLHCTLGVISQWGYVVIDDTGRPRFDEDPEWPWLVQPNIPTPDGEQCDVAADQRRDCGYIGIREIDCLGKGCCRGPHKSENGVPNCYYPKNAQQDLYFFGHGHSYTTALKEFTDISGKIPMPPRFAFGLIYSRYWAYDDFGEMEIVEQYREHGLPLDVIVSDMDWHITFYDDVKDQAGEHRGWTGFTWDKHLFPDASKYLAWCKSRGLRNTLNLHPASGVQPWEDQYTPMAMAMGIDPASKRYVPFVPEDKKFVTNWNKIVLGAREKEGVDFWWLDWQQGENWINITGVNPTFWLNYIFYTNPYHWKVNNTDQRGMLMHRFGGLGNHRYQIGFSGDVIPSWDSLDFQVYYTVIASNVGFGYWSHDLGGHVGVSPPELYTRWIQFGTFSPIFRIHSKKAGFMWRRPWLYPASYCDILMKYFTLRASLVPYTYTSAWEAYAFGVSIMRPMYYSNPGSPLAYQYDHQYMFGDAILVAPVTTPLNPVYNTSQKRVYLPADLTWVSWHSGEVFPASQQQEELTRNYTLSEAPIFVKAGSIIPTTPKSRLFLGSAKELPTNLRLLAFVAGTAVTPSDIGFGYMHEDDGTTNAYKGSPHGTYFNTNFSYAAVNETLVFHITSIVPIVTFPQMLNQRKYEIVLLGVWPAVSVSINRESVTKMQYDTGCQSDSGCFSYDGTRLAVVIATNDLSTNSSHEIIVQLTKPLQHSRQLLQTNFTGRLARLLSAKQLLDDQWGIHTVHQQAYKSLLLAGETGMRITYSPDAVEQELAAFGDVLHQARSEVAELDLSHSDNLKTIVLELLM